LLWEQDSPETHVQRSSALRWIPELVAEEATWAANDPKRKLGMPVTSVGLEAGTLTQYLTCGLREIGYLKEIWRAT
jgi:hypothetical protein